VSFDCPQWVEDALWDAARDRLTPAALARPLLVRAIVERSLRYTRARERLDEPTGPEDLAARALFFGVADVAKVAVPLAELRGRAALPAARPLRVLDVGAGAGALSLGAVAALEGPLELTLVDRDAAALRLAEDALAPRAVVRSEVADVTRWRPAGGPFGLVLAGSVLNELPEAARLGVLETLLGALANDGALVIIEPALRETSRCLHRLRDAIIERRLGSVFAPCVRRGAPCPMLARERDWCHEERPTVLPRRTRELVAETGLRDDGLKFSYLVVRRDGRSLVDAPATGRALRVVSQPRKLKGKIELDGCGDDGLVPLRLLRRNRSPSNRGFERARRGDVVIIGDDAEVGREAPVERLRPSELA
jgi:ribosomal protein RSM22 (predicted rRNA methylase)